uniref:Mab-21 domain-containing protein n=1 Tax=Globodera pallida TaxID=36090 RepID=A0A183CMN6_GLOPA
MEKSPHPFWAGTTIPPKEAGDQLSREERAFKLLKIAQRHCYEFSIFYDRLTANLQLQYADFLNENACTKLEQALAYLIFKNFMYKYPALSRFTDVIWPAEMAEDVKVQLAKEYAEKNKKTAKFSKSRCMGRMYDMRTHGCVGNPYTTKPVHMRVRRQRPYFRYYDEYSDYDHDYYDHSDYEHDYWREHRYGYDPY